MEEVDNELTVSGNFLKRHCGVPFVSSFPPPAAWSTVVTILGDGIEAGTREGEGPLRTPRARAAEQLWTAYLWTRLHKQKGNICHVEVPISF